MPSAPDAQPPGRTPLSSLLTRAGALVAVAIVAAAVLATRGTGHADQRPAADAASRSTARAPDPRSRSAVGQPRDFGTVALTVPAHNAGGPFRGRHLLTLPRGWRAEVWARVGGARF